MWKKKNSSEEEKLEEKQEIHNDYLPSGTVVHGVPQNGKIRARKKMQCLHVAGAGGDSLTSLGSPTRSPTGGPTCSYRVLLLLQLPPRLLIIEDDLQEGPNQLASGKWAALFFPSCHVGLGDNNRILWTLCHFVNSYSVIRAVMSFSLLGCPSQHQVRREGIH